MTVLAVECSACHTSFPVDPGKVPAGGVRARCSVCGGIFQVEDPTLDLTAELEHPEPTADRLGAASFPEAGPEPEFSPEPWSGVAESEEVTETAAGTVEDVWSPEDVSTVEETAGTEAVEESPEEAANMEESASAEASPDFEQWNVDLVPEQEATPSPEAVEAAEPEPEPTPTSAREDVWTVETEADWIVEEEVQEAAPEAEPSPLPSAFQFGKRDPHEKARRLARVLVSDIITYNPERYLRALENDTLQEDFDEEIRKSWAEYVDQVGSDIARDTSYWKDALNDLLARGREVF